MSTMNINVYGRDYAIACDDGEEAHLSKLTQMVNHRVTELLGQMGRAPEHTMLIYTALMLADELLDVTRAYKKLEASTKAPSAPVAAVDNDRVVEIESAMAGNLSELAEQMELLADKLEKAA
jgi:cell division protein ZapA